MLASAAPGYAGQDTARSVQAGIHEVMGSGAYYVTPDICRELQHMKNGVSHINLDTNLLKSSTEWASKFDHNAINNEKYASERAMATANNALYDIKNNMNAKNISALQDNNVREVHHHTMQNLKAVDNEIAPYAVNAVNRIHQFCDKMGVTDRYTGYRHNLTRGNLNPIRAGFSWLDNKQQNSYNSTLNVGWEPQTSHRAIHSAPVHQSKRVNIEQRPTTGYPSLHAKHTGMKMNNGGLTKSIQEQCGINTTFPGRTEYMQRYTRPNLSEKTSPFTINPSPDFYIHGRPLDKHGYIKKETEYQGRYAWPDGNKLVKLPWLRK